jgi:hypothetical protein
MANKLERAYRFFRENAGGIVGESAKTAMALARAEAWAGEHLTFWWEYDDDVEWDGEGPAPSSAPERCGAVLRRDAEPYLTSIGDWRVYEFPRGLHMLASLCGIWGADSNYRRVIQAELALEAWGRWLDGYDHTRLEQVVSFAGVDTGSDMCVRDA